MKENPLETNDFGDVWSREWAWWLGATFGDGHSDNRKGRRSLTFVSGDKDLVEKWAALCGAVVSPKGGYWKATKGDVRLTEKLAALGMAGRKGDSLRWPDALPAELVPDFVRGLWDTDGSILVSSPKNGSQPRMRAIFCNKSAALVQSTVDHLPMLTHEKQRVYRGKYTGNEYALACARGVNSHAFFAAVYAASPETLRCERKFQAGSNYLAWYSANRKPCLSCGELVLGTERCKGCRQTLWASPVACVSCNQVRKVVAKGLCRPCYQRNWKKTAGVAGWDKAGADVEWLESALAAYTGAADAEKAAILDKATSIYLRRGIPLFTAHEGVPTSPLEEVARSKLTVEGRTIRAVGTAGQRFCTSHHPHRYSAAYRSKKSAVEAFRDEKLVRRALAFQLNTGSPVVPRRALRAMCAIQKVPTNFPPTLARFLADTYVPEGGTVLDPCAGYGGRLLGVLSSPKQLRYIGFDVEPETAAANARLADATGAASRASCAVGDVLDAPPWEPADLLLTGPPYFDCENYGEASSQALSGLSYEAWVTRFMGSLFRRAANIPVVVLNVGTFRSGGHLYDYPTDTIRVAEANGFVLLDRWDWKQAAFGKSSRVEAILVFKRHHSQQ